MRFNALCHELLKLVDPNKDTFVLVGSAALAVRAMRDVNDLDVLTMPLVLDRLVAKGEPTARDGPRLAFTSKHGVIQMSDRFWSFAATCGLTAEEVIEKAEFWNVLVPEAFTERFIGENELPSVPGDSHRTISMRVICMDHFIRFKKACGRDKDMADLRMLNVKGSV